MSTRDVATKAGFNQSFVVRIELGEVNTPDPAKVAAIAKALDLNVADVMAAARYPLVPDLLSPTLYLRAKFRDLPDDQLHALQRDVARVLQRHGISPTDGPAPGEDEVVEPPTKKGGNQ